VPAGSSEISPAPHAHALAAKTNRATGEIFLIAGAWADSEPTRKSAAKRLNVGDACIGRERPDYFGYSKEATRGYTKSKVLQQDFCVR
jgi:hypothetical protein